MEERPCFQVISPKSKSLPFILSIPHCGTDFPHTIKPKYVTSQIENLDDTDWDLEKLYDFAPEMGITTIKAVYSRWVIDLNRDPENNALYNDGRIITSLCPVTDFKGDPLYKKGYEPKENNIQNRLQQYFWPYHNKINELIQKFLKSHGEVFFWDAHSIRRLVPSIHPTPFPDLILGNNNNLACCDRITKTAINELNKGDFQVAFNQPFKGGYLTRSIGKPNKNIHALQLEMSKDIYMSNNEMKYDKDKALVIKKLLFNTFEQIIDDLK